MINRNNPVWVFMAKTLKNSDAIQDLYNKALLLLHKKSFLKEVERRKGLSIFDSASLAAPLPFCPIECIADANFYGYAHAIKRYAGVEKQNYSLEHGLYFDDYIPRACFWESTKRVITINEEREELIRQKVGKPVYSVGPYIHYADSLLSDEEIREIKQQYGRILLVFPSHSNVEAKAVFDEVKFIEDIKQFAIKYQFDTVLVNLFYHDILHNRHVKAYKEAGFKIVTAGHRYDLNFVGRLKAFIRISDYTIGNSVGTHIGYCIYMGKPHYIMDDYKIESSDSKQYRAIYEPFSIYSEDVTARQYNIAAYYWGFDCIKSKEDMLNILKQI